MNKKSTTIDFKIGNFSIFHFCSVSGLGWFKIFGVGLHWKNTLKHEDLFFSEKFENEKTLKIKSWRIGLFPLR